MMRVLGLAALAACVAAPALAQDDFQWIYDRYLDPDSRQARVSLGYAVPESDAIQFAALCQPGPQVPTVEVEISAFVGSLQNGTRVDVFFTGDGFSRGLSGTVSGVGAEVGIVGVTMTVTLDDPLWGGIRSLGEIQYYIAGQQPDRLRLAGAANPTAQFLADCRNLPAVNANAGNGIRRPGPPPPGGRPAAPPPAEMAGLSCDLQQSLRTASTGPSTTVTFINESDGMRSVFWLDGDGVPRPYANLDPGQRYDQQTYVGHPWMITDGPGNCLALYMPTEAPSEFRITGSLVPGEPE